MTLKEIQKNLPAGAGLLITSKANIKFLADFSLSSGQIFVTKTSAYLLTDFRYTGLAKKVLPKEIKLFEVEKRSLDGIRTLAKKHKIFTIFFEPKDLSYYFYKKLKKTVAPIRFIPSKISTETIRTIKSLQEIRLITRAQRIAEKIFREITKKLKSGQTEIEIGHKIEELAHKYGAEAVSFDPIAAFGKNSGIPHHQNTGRKLKKGDIVLIDMGVKYQGYCSDMTRTIFTAPPTAKQKLVYETVLKAQKTVIKKLHAGVRGAQADKWARDIITDAGFGPNFGHSTGHGVGLEIHEMPNLSPGLKGKDNPPFPSNTIVTVEPGIYIENSFGVRIEDMVLIMHDNVVNLTKIPKEIKDVVFRIS
jgi:Xaa-Pro aminopeptidase